MKIFQLSGMAVFTVATMLGYGALDPALGAQPVEMAADAQGNLHVPKDYRTHYEYLGSWAIASDSGKGSKQIHTVYASPGAVAGYKKEGHFADGTILIKEVFDVDTDSMTTGTVSRVKSLQGWFVMIKDSQNRHPDSKLWGEGWGWSWFDAPRPDKTTSTDYKKDCLGCHVPAKGTDWIYTQGYAPLKMN
jgi:hypothetical protein